MMEIKPPEEEINEVLNRCAEHSEKGTSQYHGMTYEDGVRAGIDWVLGYVEENPLE